MKKKNEQNLMHIVMNMELLIIYSVTVGFLSFLFKNKIMSTVESFKQLLLSEINSPALENNRSDDTDVAVMQRNFLAIVANLGNTGSLAFHHVNGSSSFLSC